MRLSTEKIGELLRVPLRVIPAAVVYLKLIQGFHQQDLGLVTPAWTQGCCLEERSDRLWGWQEYAGALSAGSLSDQGRDLTKQAVPVQEWVPLWANPTVKPVGVPDSRAGLSRTDSFLSLILGGYRCLSSGARTAWAQPPWPSPSWPGFYSSAQPEEERR